jgi:hypothetical protein
VREDGVVSIESLSGGDYFHGTHSRPLRAISLHPRYKSQDDKPFVCRGREGKLFTAVEAASQPQAYDGRRYRACQREDEGVFQAAAHVPCLSRGLVSLLLGIGNSPGGGLGNQVFQIDVTTSRFGMGSSAQFLHYFCPDKPKKPLSLLGLCSYYRTSMAVLSPDLSGYVPEVEVALVERTLGEQKVSDELVVRARRASRRSH